MFANNASGDCWNAIWKKRAQIKRINNNNTRRKNKTNSTTINDAQRSAPLHEVVANVAKDANDVRCDATKMRKKKSRLIIRLLHVLSRRFAF